MYLTGSKYAFDNKEKHARDAAYWLQYIQDKYDAQINHSISHTSIWLKNSSIPSCTTDASVSCDFTVLKTDTVSAIELYTGKGNNVAALNFASYKNPGGMFLRGSMAQEEALCHASILYPVLSAFEQNYYTINRKDLNHALYQNSLLYSKDILFEKSNKVFKADIITCAAPNWNAFSKYNDVNEHTQKMNRDALTSRFIKLLFVANYEQVDTLILGAWGCGVFGQSPEEVSEIMIASILGVKTNIKHIVFALTDKQMVSIFESKVNELVCKKKVQ